MSGAPRAVPSHILQVNLLVMAKAPVRGQVKTRLSPPLTPTQAAALAEASLRDTLAAVAAAPTARRVLALDGALGDWPLGGFEVIPQPAGRLPERLAAAFEAVGGPALCVGTDSPQITAASLAHASGALLSPGVDAVLGPAVDGGYWAIGLREPDERVFHGVPMSSPETAGAQRRRLAELGLRHVELPTLRDVDTFDDARAVAGEAPGSRFAAALRAILGDRREGV